MGLVLLPTLRAGVRAPAIDSRQAQRPPQSIERLEKTPVPPAIKFGGHQRQPNRIGHARSERASHAHSKCKPAEHSGLCLLRGQKSLANSVNQAARTCIALQAIRHVMWQRRAEKPRRQKRVPVRLACGECKDSFRGIAINPRLRAKQQTSKFSRGGWSDKRHHARING